MEYKCSKWQRKGKTNLFTSKLGRRPTSAIKSLEIFNSSSSVAQVTLNRLNFASKLNRTWAPYPPSTLTRHVSKIGTFIASKKLENVQLWDCFNLETMLLKNFLTQKALETPNQDSWFRSTLFLGYCLPFDLVIYFSAVWLFTITLFYFIRVF